MYASAAAKVCSARALALPKAGLRAGRAKVHDDPECFPSRTATGGLRNVRHNVRERVAGKKDFIVFSVSAWVEQLLLLPVAYDLVPVFYVTTFAPVRTRSPTLSRSASIRELDIAAFFKTVVSFFATTRNEPPVQSFSLTGLFLLPFF